MPPQPLEFSVESLERRVTNLELLPARIDDLASQILHLRTEMRGEFSAVRSEMADQGTALRQVIADQGATLRQEMAEQGAGLHAKIDGLATHMRVLHEEVIARIALLSEAPRAPGRRRKK